MPTIVVRRTAPSLERRLLQNGVGALAAGRATCRDCGRTPLVGELIHHYASGRMLCELCRRGRREDPVSSEPVRSSEFGHAVRIRDNRAAARAA
jgi:hypothetical protein